MNRFVRLVLVMLLLAGFLPAEAVVTAQEGEACPGAPAPRLEIGRHGVVLPGPLVNARLEAGIEMELVGMLAAGSVFQVVDGPRCVEGAYWWQVATMDYWGVWIPEGERDTYYVEPYVFIPAPPVALGVPMTEPQMTAPDVPLPPITPAGMPAALDYTAWDWQRLLDAGYYFAPDPLALQLPEAYAGDFPVPPVDLDTVHFAVDAGLNADQLALLARNGFVVVPGEYAQFDEMYTDETWPHQEGKGDFITTDVLLHTLFLTYQNTLMALEKEQFYGLATSFIGRGYEAAEAQWREAAGTALEAPARSAAIFYAVPLILLAEAEADYVGPFGEELFRPDSARPSAILPAADAGIMAEAQAIVALIDAAEGREAVPILDDLEEDFSQYKARGYYAGDPLLEAYFRAMMWLGRITFKARSQSDTLAGLLALRALQDGGAYEDWLAMAETLDFFVGPVDDLSPRDYAPLAAEAFGAGLPLEALADPARLDAFLDGVMALPGPRVNSIPLPIGITAEEVDEFTRGFRLFGQRFTLDGYLMQQLIYPEVGTATASRALPLGLDVASVLGSDHAYTLAEEAGATAFLNYTENSAALREEVGALTPEAWLENLYGGWLWALQPLLVRDPALVPPLMQTDAWQRKDILTTLGSWTELKHATLLYAEQPYGGLGGGGMEPPVISTSIVEPNPEVFARIAIVAGTLSQGLQDRGLVESPMMRSYNSALNSLAMLSARLMEIARRELAGEPVPYEELYFLQEHFGQSLWSIRYAVELWISNPPENVALVADVASNPAAGTVLEEAIGLVDMIYVVANGPHGLHLTRGAVYTQYEFEHPIDSRLTDDEWRAMLAAGEAPPRHEWTRLYFSE
ncbi:MAG: DUF3160 domain-containing protein [Anaerolineae bacterium]|nr:DUF3160 domain-containing protein [Anaerolineae bacterium]